MAKQIIFDLPGGEYRALCIYGENYSVEAWWCLIQRKSYRRKWLLFGPLVEIWDGMPQFRCWFSKSFDTRKELQKAAEDYYDECVLMPKRIREKALNL